MFENIPEILKNNQPELRSRCVEFVRELQDIITTEFEKADPSGKFEEHLWDRPGGGGGRTRVVSGGNIFENGGVNTSVVFGKMDDTFSEKLPGKGSDFFATGISLVLHPKSPMIPTVHMNYRFIQKGEKSWFGGGQDLTPYYPFEKDCEHFHTEIKKILDEKNSDLYPRLKTKCDEYFYNKHRKEPRGIGGIFFDYIEDLDFEKTWRSLGHAFVSSYLPIVEKRKEHHFSENQREFQLYRRGRYVEFNLIHDRGTLFGLKTGGNIPSILMSLPANVKWGYELPENLKSDEKNLLDFLNKKNWA